MTNAEKEKLINEKLFERKIFVDDKEYTLDEFNEMFGGEVGVQVDCSTITLYISGSQGVTSCEDVLKYGEDFTTLQEVVDLFYEMLANNALENLQDYLDDQLDGLDPDELDEDELDELKGEAQAEAECDSGERQIIIKTIDGGNCYFNIEGDDLVFSECYYF